jgi:hypothetical protein
MRSETPEPTEPTEPQPAPEPDTGSDDDEL